MSNGNPNAVIYLKKPIRIGEGDYSIIYCQPKVDSKSPLSGVSTTFKFIEIGVQSSSGIGYSVALDSIESIIWDDVDGSISAVLATQLETLQGYLSLV